MTALPVTAFYAALLAFVLLWLSIRVVQERRRSRIALGARDDHALLCASRAHGNFTEYVPFALILLALLEASGTGPILLHALGVALLGGRVAHGVGLGREPAHPTAADFRLRQIGMALTFGVLAAGGLLLLARTVIR